MTHIKLLPEYGLSYNIEKGMIEPEAAGIPKLNFKPINESLDKMDKYADDLMNSLTATGAFLESFPGREKSIYYASIWTNIFYGFIFGGIVAFVLVMLKLGGLI